MDFVRRVMAPGTAIPFIGRDADLRAVEAHLAARAASGCGALVVIEGEPGIGKSRLLTEWLSRAAHHGCTVLRGRCEDADRGRPFGPFVDVLGLSPRAPDARRAAIGRVLGGKGPAPPAAAAALDGPDRDFLVIDGVLGLLEAMTDRERVVLALEDLHWADDATLRAVRTISRRLDQLPVVLIATLRPVQRPLLTSLLEALRAEEAHITRLEPLSDNALISLTRELVGAAPGRSLVEQMSKTGGNPLFVIELVNALQSAGSIAVVDGHAEAIAATRSPDLAEAILRRLDHLSAEAHHVLRLASILGASFLPAELATVAGESLIHMSRHLDECIHADVVVSVGEKLAFRHDLIHQAIYDDIPLGVRRGLHLEVARALRAAGATSLSTARHIALGATSGDDALVAELRDAALSCLLDNPTAAVVLLGALRDLLPVGDTRRTEATAHMVMPLELLGRTAEVESCAADVLASEPGKDLAVLVRSGLAYSLLVRGQPADAETHYETLTQMNTDGGPPWRPSVNLANLAISRLHQGKVEQAQSPVSDAVRLAEACGDAYALSIALTASWNLWAVQGFVAESLAVAERAVRTATSDPSAHLGNVWPYACLGIALGEEDRHDDGEAQLAQGRRLAAEQGRASQLPVFDAALATSRLAIGAWDDAVPLLNAVVTASSEVGDRFGGVATSLAHLAFVAMQRGDLREAGRLMEHVMRHASEHTMTLYTDYIGMVRVSLLEARSETLSGLAQVRSQSRGASYAAGLWRWTCPELVRIALARGEHDTARQFTEDAEEGARRAGGVPSADGAAALCRGRLDGDVEALLGAVEAYRQGARVLDLGWACEEGSIHLAKLDRKEEAMRLADEALLQYEGLGAERNTQRFVAALRALGVRRGTRAARARPKIGWESLTPTERRVVELVGQGLMNKEIAERLFVSRFTVETHLRHVFQKMGVRSRGELIARRAHRDAT